LIFIIGGGREMNKWIGKGIAFLQGSDAQLKDFANRNLDCN
jgi:hypothetical protein